MNEIAIQQFLYMEKDVYRRLVVYSYSKFIHIILDDIE